MNHQLLKFVAAALALGWVGLAVAAPDVGQAEKQGLNIHAIVMFFIQDFRLSWLISSNAGIS